MRLSPAPYHANHDGSHQPELHLGANIIHIQRVRLISPQTTIVNSSKISGLLSLDVFLCTIIEI